WGAPDDLARIAPRLFEQHVKDAAKASRIERSLLPVDRALQPVEPFGLDIVGNLIGRLRGRRSGPRRVFEGESAGVAHFVDQRQRRAKIVLALAGEADDEVGRERHFRWGGAQARNRLEITGAGVAEIRALEAVVRA